MSSSSIISNSNTNTNNIANSTRIAATAGTANNPERVTSHLNLATMMTMNVVHATTEFVAYVVINEATMLDVRYRSSMLKFKLTAGN